MSLPPPVPDNRPFAERLRQAEAAIVERDLRVRHCWEQARAQTHERTQAVASWGARAGAALLGWWVVRRLRRYRRLSAAQGVVGRPAFAGRLFSLAVLLLPALWSSHKTPARALWLEAARAVWSWRRRPVQSRRRAPAAAARPDTQPVDAVRLGLGR